MKRIPLFLLALALMFPALGCGGATPSPETAETTEPEILEESPDYEQEMMGGGEEPAPE